MVGTGRGLGCFVLRNNIFLQPAPSFVKDLLFPDFRNLFTPGAYSEVDPKPQTGTVNWDYSEGLLMRGSVE